MWDHSRVAASVRLVLALAAIPLGIAAYRVQVHDFHAADKATAIVAVAWTFLVAGVIAWWRRPANRLGPLMVIAGYALLARQFRYSHDALLFTVFFALGDLSYALVANVALAYPSGRVSDRTERSLVNVGYATVLAFPLLILLFHPARSHLLGFSPYPRKSLLLVAADAHLALLLQKAFVVALYLVLGTLYVALIARRLLLASPRMRRILMPLLLAAILLALRGTSEAVFTFAARRIAYGYLFWWQVTAFIAVPLALLAGLLRARLARATVGDLVVELEHAPPHGLRAALARALGDPTLELAFWLPERREYVDAKGTRVELPGNGGERAVTHLDRDGEPLAALIHDRSLDEEQRLVRAAAAAVRLTLENAQLHAEMRAQLREVEASRVRIVAAADEERRRIERDLHDGAQQRLVALALQLRSAQRRLGTKADPEVERILTGSVDELQAAVGELRELAHGVHPAILSEEGLAAALESLMARTPFPVSVNALEGRLPPHVEATAYFVCCEALANVIKHARASGANVSAQRRNGVLVVEIEDDGVGGARAEDGAGLRGLIDRVEALGGRLRIENPPEGGARVVAEIPCVS